MSINLIALFVTIPIVVLTVGFVIFLRRSSMAGTPSESALSTTSKANPRTLGYWIVSVILGAFFIFAGLPKLLGVDVLIHQFSEWGYSENFRIFIGSSQIVAGILLLIPRTSLFAALYLAAVMTGATYTHLAFDNPLWALLPLSCLGLLGFVAYEDFRRKMGAGQALVKQS